MTEDICRRCGASEWRMSPEGTRKCRPCERKRCLARSRQLPPWARENIVVEPPPRKAPGGGA